MPDATSGPITFEDASAAFVDRKRLWLLGLVVRCSRCSRGCVVDFPPPAV
jgi:hypothetical protein